MNAVAETALTTEPPYLLDWHWSNDAVCEEFLGARTLMQLEIPVSDLGARIVAQTLADYFDHLWMTLNSSSFAFENQPLLDLYDDTAISLREMSRGQDDAAHDAAFLEADAGYECRPLRGMI